MFAKVESDLFWYSRAKAITSSLDSFFSTDSDNDIFIIEKSLGYLLKSAISITNYYHICSLHLLEFFLGAHRGIDDYTLFFQ